MKQKRLIPPSFLFFALLSLCRVASYGQNSSITFNYTGSSQAWEVPSCVTSIEVSVAGAEGGGSNSGEGALVTGTLSVTPGDVLEIYVGGEGSCPNNGYNGGGSGVTANTIANGSCGGGGASDIRVAPYQLNNRIIVASGGGGTGGGDEDAFGGEGGCDNGIDGTSPFGIGGNGASQTNGGNGGIPWDPSGNTGDDGILGIGGDGAFDPCYNLGPGGGAGGGYYGGGGGGSDCWDIAPLGGGGGGGGSSLTPTGCNCVASSNSGNGYVTISFSETAISSDIITTNVSCFNAFDAEITPNLSSINGPITTLWEGINNFNSSAEDITNLGPGDYSFSASDNNGCTFDTTITITEPSEVTLTESIVADVSCAGAADASIEIELTGGTLPYAYNWTGPPPFTSTDEDLYNLIAGGHLLNLTDANGCLFTFNFNPTAPSPINPQIIIDNISCLNTADGALSSNVFGGLLPYNYSWTGPGTFTANTATVNSLLSGTYSLTITDANNCQQTTSNFLGANPLPEPILATTSFCDGETLVLDPGTFTSYSWSTTETSSSITVSNTGLYEVTVIDANNCSNDASANITVNPSPNPTLNDLSLCEGNTATITPGIFDSYLWNTDEITASIDASSGGNFSVTVSNSFNCYNTASCVIDLLPAPQADAGEDFSICLGEDTQLNGNIIGTGIWTPATGLSDPTTDNPTVVGLTETTTYTLTVTNTSSNSVYNGDFELGDIGFTSDFYTPTTPGGWGVLSEEGTYAVDNDASNAHTNFIGFDHTNPPNGNFLIVNGGTTANSSIWCQTISVIPNTDYEFSTWVSSVVAENPASLEFSVNGVLIGNSFNAPATTGIWEEYTTSWNSGSNSSATICIVNQNTTESGNDFGIDDISFNAICINTDEATVTVNPNPLSSNITISECEESYNSNSQEFNLTDYSSLISSELVTYFSDATLNSQIDNTTSYTAFDTQNIYAEANNSFGCSSSSTVNFNILNLPEANAVSASYCEENAASNTATINLNTLNSQISSNTINWHQDAALTSPITNTTNYVATDETIYVQTSNLNCSNSTTVNLTINSVPNLQYAGTDSICWGNSFNLENISLVDNNSTNGNISIHSSTPANMGNTLSNNSVNPAFSNSYYFLSTTSNGCTDETSFDLVVNPTPNPNAGIDQSICGLLFNLNVTNSDSGNWVGANANFTDNASPSSFVDVPSYGNYTFIWEAVNAYGCTNSDNINIDFVSPPTVDAGSDFELCPGDEVLISSAFESSTNALNWSTNGDGSFLSSNTLNTVYYPGNNDLSSGEAILTLSGLNAPCPQATDSIFVNSRPQPTANIRGEGDHCDDGSNSVLYIDLTGTPPFQYTFSNGMVDFPMVSNGFSDSLSVAESGFFLTQNLVDSYCPGINNGVVQIINRPIPIAEFSAQPYETDIEHPFISFINQSQLADQFRWSFGDGNTEELIYHPVHEYDSVGTFQVALKVETEFGCVDSIERTVIINPVFYYFVPNAFTPDNDGLNEGFIGKGFGIREFQMQIFDRWGELIYQTNDQENPWLGTYHNGSEKVQTGIYSYHITIIDEIGKLHEYTGEVTLAR